MVEGTNTIKKPPRIEIVEAIGPTRLRIAWTTGERLEVDLAEPVNRLKALAPLCDPAAFARVQVGEWGHSLVWAGEIDLGAHWLAIPQSSRNSPLTVRSRECSASRSGWLGWVMPPSYSNPP